MGKSKIIVVGIGPGSPEDMTPAVLESIRESDVVVGYKYYFQFIKPYLNPGARCVDTGMKKEKDRAQQAFELAEEGNTVTVISSGDAGIYGMIPLIYEMKKARGSDVEIVSDSKYVTDAFNQDWIGSWIKNGWKKSDKKPVLNTDLWKRLLEAKAPHNVTFTWVKGHNDHPENERCDKMAVEAALSSELLDDVAE